MLYDDVLFRGEHIFKERARVSRERMTAATLSSWQVLSVEVGEKFPKLGAYLKMFGLSDEKKVTKKELKNEYDQGLANVARIQRLHKGA